VARWTRVARGTRVARWTRVAQGTRVAQWTREDMRVEMISVLILLLNKSLHIIRYDDIIVVFYHLHIQVTFHICIFK